LSLLLLVLLPFMLLVLRRHMLLLRNSLSPLLLLLQFVLPLHRHMGSLAAAHAVHGAGPGGHLPQDTRQAVRTLQL
jgi:hypothetical protein